MKILNCFILIIITTTFNSLFAQNDTLRIFDQKAKIISDEDGKLFYYLSIKSENPDFEYDTYKFIIPNQIGFDEYENVNKIKRKVRIDSMDISEPKELSKMSNCELHNNLSKKSKIYLVDEKEFKNYSNGEKYMENFIYPLIYQGTEKNIQILDMH